MHIKCSAVVDNPLQQENLVQCIIILGGHPVHNKADISVDFKGTEEQADKFISLFEHYIRHDIRVLS